MWKSHCPFQLTVIKKIFLYLIITCFLFNPLSLPDKLTFKQFLCNINAKYSCYYLLMAPVQNAYLWFTSSE